MKKSIYGLSVTFLTFDEMIHCSFKIILDGWSLNQNFDFQDVCDFRIHFCICIIFYRQTYSKLPNLAWNRAICLQNSTKYKYESLNQKNIEKFILQVQFVSAFIAKLCLFWFLALLLKVDGIL